MGDEAASRELDFTRKIFLIDAKNYHAWSHRQWVLQNLGGWVYELDYCAQFLDEDIFNNSAWYRPRRYLHRLSFSGFEAKIMILIRAFGANDPRIPSVCLSVLKEQRDLLFSLSTVMDLLSHGLKSIIELADSINALRTSDPETPGSSRAMVRSICSILGSRDLMRANYRARRKNKLLQA